MNFKLDLKFNLPTPNKKVIQFRQASMNRLPSDFAYLNLPLIIGLSSWRKFPQFAKKMGSLSSQIEKYYPLKLDELS